MPTLTEMRQALQVKIKEDAIYDRIQEAMAKGEKSLSFKRTNDLDCDDANSMHPITANKLVDEEFTVVLEGFTTYYVSGWDRL